jgi:hypothetical protein
MRSAPPSRARPWRFDPRCSQSRNHADACRHHPRALAVMKNFTADRVAVYLGPR